MIVYCIFLYSFLQQTGHCTVEGKDSEKKTGKGGWVLASRTNPSGMALSQNQHYLSVNSREAAGDAETHSSSLSFMCQSYRTNMITHSVFQPLLWITLDLKWSKCTLHLKRAERHTHSGLFSVPLLCPSPLKLEGIHMNQKCWSFTKALGRGKGHPQQAGKMHAILPFPLIP